MAGRSTRNKIKGQVRKAIEDMDRCMAHLMYCDKLSDGRSAFINDHLPGIIIMIEGFRVVLVQYEEML